MPGVDIRVFCQAYRSDCDAIDIRAQFGRGFVAVTVRQRLRPINGSV
jgi:hypothetical protein